MHVIFKYQIMQFYALRSKRSKILNKKVIPFNRE